MPFNIACIHYQLENVFFLEKQVVMVVYVNHLGLTDTGVIWGNMVVIPCRT